MRTPFQIVKVVGMILHFYYLLFEYYSTINCIKRKVRRKGIYGQLNYNWRWWKRYLWLSFLYLLPKYSGCVSVGVRVQSFFSLGMVLISMMIMSIINYYVIIISLSKKVYSAQLHFHQLLPSIFTWGLICSKADFTSLSSVKIGS